MSRLRPIPLSGAVVRVSMLVLAVLGGCGGEEVPPSGTEAQAVMAADAAASDCGGIAQPGHGQMCGRSAQVAQANGSLAALQTIPIPKVRTVTTPAPALDATELVLRCGTVYLGTLDLSGRSSLSVRTAGDCGKAVITPARPVQGWVRHQGNIYVTEVAGPLEQVVVDSRPMPLAHWPNLPVEWATQLATLPAGDLDGAILYYKPHHSRIMSVPLTAGSTITVGEGFYVEGKRWMLDSPGEWVVEDNKLYLWMPDGDEPRDRVWAVPKGAHGINADNTSDVTIEGLTVLFGVHGISANRAKRLRVTGTDIANNELDGIYASASVSLSVERVNVLNARRNGIDGWFSGTSARVRNATVRNTGMVNKPTPTDAGIHFAEGPGNLIENVRVVNSAYHGISVLKGVGTIVRGSVVDTACVRLTDCGGIYTYAYARQVDANVREVVDLRQVFEGNTVSNVRGTGGMGIYLDDSSNGVTVTRNTLIGNTRGMMIHSGFKNTVTDNLFLSSLVTHIAFPQDAGKPIRENSIQRNIFRSSNGEQTFNMGPDPDPRAFASIDYNHYQTNTPASNSFLVNYPGNNELHTRCSLAEWRTWSGHDQHSTLNGRALPEPAARGAGPLCGKERLP